MDIGKAKALIEKYNRPGPRYTSYPTALKFDPEVEVESLLADTRQSRDPLSLYFHLPFCESLCWFCACTTVITCNRDRVQPYTDALLREMDQLLEEMQPGRLVEQLHFGGGSPSFYTNEQMDELCTAIHERFQFSDEAEISAELDPRTLSKEKVEVLAKHGFNRVSFGVQDVNPDVQKAVHRIQPDDMNRRCLEWIRDAGIDSINTDLIYGLPKQNVETFSETLDTVLSYNPSRFAVFSYAHVPWVAPAQKILEKKDLPDPETKFQMLLKAIEKLTDAGYVYVGMDHFAKADDELVKALENGDMHRNFQGYSTKAGREMAGFGMSSISQTPNTYRQNAKELDDYYEKINAGKSPIAKGYLTTADDRLRREIIMTLMCSGTVNFNEIGAKYGIDFNSYFGDALEAMKPLKEDGLVNMDSKELSVTRDGRLLLRNIAMPFDAYLRDDSKSHAKTI